MVSLLSTPCFSTLLFEYAVSTEQFWIAVCICRVLDYEDAKFYESLPVCGIGDVAHKSGCFAGPDDDN